MVRLILRRPRAVALLLLCSVLLVRCVDISATETERLRNTPPELSSGAKSSAKSNGKAQARFLPFSASFSLSAGGGNAQSFSVASGPDGIGLSQSSSQAAGSGNGGPGFSASQSSSLAAGLNGISASDSNAVAANHPLHGQTTHANGNSLALGQAAASSHGDVVNGQAVSGAQSSVGSTNTHAASSAQSFVQQARPTWSNAQPNYATGNNGDYYYNSRQPPSLTITVSDRDNTYQDRQPSGGWYEVSDRDSRDSWQPPHYCKNYNGWYRDPRCRRPEVTITKPGYINKPFYEQRDPRKQRPGIQIRPVSAVTSAQSGSGGLALSQSSGQFGGGHHPTTTINQAQVSGNAQAHAQGAAGGIAHGRPGQLGANLSSGTVSLTSRPGGFAQGSSHASSSNGGSTSHATGTSSGGASAQSNANAGSVVAFPGPSSHTQIIPPEFVRSAKKPKERDSLEELVGDITDTVYGILDY